MCLNYWKKKQPTEQRWLKSITETPQNRKKNQHFCLERSSKCFTKMKANLLMSNILATIMDRDNYTCPSPTITHRPITTTHICLFQPIAVELLQKSVKNNKILEDIYDYIHSLVE